VFKIDINRKIDLPFVKLNQYSGLVHAIFIGKESTMLLCSEDGDSSCIEFIPIEYVNQNSVRNSSKWNTKFYEKRYQSVTALKYDDQCYKVFIGPEGWDEEEFLLNLYELDRIASTKFREMHSHLLREHVEYYGELR